MGDGEWLVGCQAAEEAKGAEPGAPAFNLPDFFAKCEQRLVRLRLTDWPMGIESF
jgi:hypothetical protein